MQTLFFFKGHEPKNMWKYAIKQPTCYLCSLKNSANRVSYWFLFYLCQSSLQHHVIKKPETISVSGFFIGQVA